MIVVDELWPDIHKQFVTASSLSVGKYVNKRCRLLHQFFLAFLPTTIIKLKLRDRRRRRDGGVNDP